MDWANRGAHRGRPEGRTLLEGRAVCLFAQLVQQESIYCVVWIRKRLGQQNQRAFRSGRASTCAKLLQLCTWLWSKTLLAVTVAVHSVEKAKVGLVLVFVD